MSENERIDQSREGAEQFGANIHQILLNQVEQGNVEAIKLLIQTGHIILPNAYHKDRLKKAGAGQ